MFNVMNSQILIFYRNFLVFPNIGDIIFITQTSKGANKMAKYFKATISPKKGYLKTNPDAADIILATNESGTQAEFKEALIAMLDEEGMTNDYFAPRIERCTEEEFNLINADDDQDESSEVEVTIESNPKLFEILKDGCDFDVSDIPKHGKGYVVPEAKIDGNLYRYNMRLVWDYTWGIEEWCENNGGAWILVNVDNEGDRELLTQDSDFEDVGDNKPDFDDHQSELNIDSQTGEVKSDDQQEVYRYFEFEKGYAAIIKTEFEIFSGKWLGSFTYLRSRYHHQLENQFSSDENAAVNAIGSLIDHLNAIKNEVEDSGVTVGTWYKKTVMGLASDGEGRLINSIITKGEYDTIMNKLPLAGVNLEPEETSVDEKFQPFFDSIAKHAESSKLSAGDLGKISGNIEEMFSEATEGQINIASETIDAMRDIKRLSNPEDFAEIFAFIFEEREAKLPEFKYPAVYDAVAELRLNSGEKSIASYASLEKAIPEGSDEELIASELLKCKPTIKELTENPEIFLKAIGVIKTKTKSMSEAFARAGKAIEMAGKVYDGLKEELEPCKAVETKETDDWLSELASPKQETEKEPEQSDFDKQVSELNAKLDALELGERLVIEDLPNDVYHACNGISSTKLKVAMSSLMKFDAKYVSKTIPEQEKTDYFDLGKLFHTMTLEPHLVDVEYFREPEDFKAPTKPQRDKYNAWLELGKPSKKDNAKAYPTDLMINVCEKEDQMISDAAGRCIVSNENWLKAEAMAKAVRDDSDSGRLVKAPNLRCETSYFKRDEDTGLIIKCRPDAELGAIVADLKSISLRSEPDEENLINKLRWEVIQRGYHVSAAMYLEITGKSQFIWIFTGTQEGYHWNAPIMAGNDILSDGSEKYRYYLKMISLGYETGEWAKPSSVQIRYEGGKAIIPEI
ncbi:putative RecE [Vibrio phage vB_Vp_PvVp04_M]|nr:putative RecE [Vibrio phage vB_Vp_PvVp04_M]